MTGRRPHHGFTILEVVISLALVIVLLALLLPALRSARTLSHREQCADQLTMLGIALDGYAQDNNDQFPSVPGQPSWGYGGLRYSAAKGAPFLDQSRPLNRWLINAMPRISSTELFCCPADYGIGGEVPEAGTGRRSACHAFGTSYRANATLFDARMAGLTEQPRGMYRSEVTTAPSRLLVLGDAVWFEVYESTGRDAEWHRQPGIGNVLFLDGSVKFQAVRPKHQTGPIAINPFVPGTEPNRVRAVEQDD